MVVNIKREILNKAGCMQENGLADRVYMRSRLDNESILMMKKCMSCKSSWDGSKLS